MENSDIMSKLSDLFSDEENIPDGIKNLINNLNMNSNDSPNNSQEKTNGPNIDIDMLMKAKKIADSMNSNNDPRKSLLLSLKPYLKDEKKDKIDQYVQFLGIAKIIETMGPELFGSDSHDK